MSDCNPINKATCHANGDFHILEEPLVSKCVSSFCGFFIFIAIISQMNPPITAGKIQNNNDNCHPNPHSLANGILTPDALVANVAIQVVYKLVIIATFCGNFSLITPGKNTIQTAILSPTKNVPIQIEMISDIDRILIPIICRYKLIIKPHSFVVEFAIFDAIGDILAKAISDNLVRTVTLQL